jgi:hypothetical protein
MAIRNLDKLVARAIIDPEVSHAVCNGSRAEVLAGAGFQAEMREELTALEASTWEDFAADAYRIVMQSEPVAMLKRFPSTLEGLQVKGSEHKLAA